MSWMFVLFGLASLTGQILLLREVLVIFHGTEISMGIFFGAWLMGIGVGASVGARLVRPKQRDPLGVFLHCISALGFSLIFQIVLVRLVPSIFGASPAELAPLHGVLAAVPLGTFSTSFLTGFLFPVGCQAFTQAEGRTIGRLYGLEALGGLIGGVVFTFLLARFFPPPRIAGALAVLLALGAMIVAVRFRVRSTLLTALPLLLVGLLLCSPLGVRVVDSTVRLRWQGLHPGLNLLVSRPTPYQQVEIAQLGKQRSLFGNGKIIASFPDPHTADRLAAMVLAQNPEAKSLLLIGGGIGSLVKALLQYPIQRLDVVEPDPWALDLAKAHMTHEELGALHDPRVQLIFGDGRFYVNRLKKRQYDIIVCSMPDPVSSFWNRYYTEEFFRAASRALSRNGIFVTKATSAENFWGNEVASYAGSVYHTLGNVFSHVKGTPGDETLFFASNAPGTVNLDPRVLAVRYATLNTHAFDPAGFKTLLPPERTRFVETELKRSPRSINTDFAPLSSSLAMILWGRFSGSGHMELLNTIRRAGIKLYLIPFTFFLLARVCFRTRWGPRQGSEARFQVLLAMAAVGGAAMGIQIVLIYSYQSLFGYVFERIGLVAATFMAGLVVGAFGGGEFVNRVQRKSLVISLMLILFAVFCLACPVWLKRLASMPSWQIELAVFAMVAGSGVLTGMVFPLVASRHLEISGSAGESSGWTDALDHFGAAIGALITGTLLVPLLGISEGSLVLALALSIPAILILVEILFKRIDPMLDQYRSSAMASFPYRRMSWVLIFAVLASFAWYMWVGPPGRPPQVRFPRQTLEAVSGSRHFTFRSTPFPHYKGKSADEKTFTISLGTIPPAGDVKGYGGPINLLLSVNNQGLIQGLSMVESRETPSYIKGIDRWLEQFKGLSVRDPLEEEIDAMTGATITSRAISRIVAKTGQRIAEPLLGFPAGVTKSLGSQSKWSIVRDLRLWAVVLLLIFFVYSFYSRSQRLRLTCLAVSTIVLGIYLNAPFTTLDATSLVSGEIPAHGTIWRNTLLAGIFVISFLWGQAFCGFLCPFGAVQEFLSIRKLRLRASQRLEQTGRYIKYVILTLLLCLFFFTSDAIWFSFSPLQHFFGCYGANFFLARMDTWILALCMAVLVASIFYFRFWCRYLCPAGAFLALFNKVALLRNRAPKPIPGRCDLGVSYQEDVDCIRCHRCLHQSSSDSRRH
jgi:predicted membrane-bound spermidine synthase